MSGSPEIAIVGAGPAGLTASIMLHRCGYRVRVFELDSSLHHRMQGGTLDLHADSGQLALSRAGLLKDFRAIARHEDQETKNVNPLTGLADEVGPQPIEEMDRPEVDRGVLRELLLSAIPADCVVWDAKVERVEPNSRGPHRLIFQDGAVTEADIIIGADGCWSRVRRSLSQVSPSYTSITFMEGWIEAPTSTQADLVGKGSMFAFGGPETLVAQKNGAGRICVYAAAKRSQPWLKTQLEKVSSLTLVREMFKGWSPNLLELICGCKSFTARPIYSLPADFTWTSIPGLTLIGDAAHVMPPLGVGVNLAMLDASDMAIAISQADDWRDAMKQAESAIRQRARGYMGQIIPQFEVWFAEPSPVLSR